MERLVFDTSAILNFGKRGGCEFLLERLAAAYELLTTPEVERELADPETASFYKALLKRRFKVRRAEGAMIDLSALSRLTGVLGSGELSVILLGLELKAIVVLDEKVARTVAVELKLRVMGTLGILAEGVRRRWCTDDQCSGIVRKLHGNGFHVRPIGANETFKEYLNRAGK